MPPAAVLDLLKFTKGSGVVSDRLAGESNTGGRGCCLRTCALELAVGAAKSSFGGGIVVCDGVVELRADVVPGKGFSLPMGGLVVVF